MAFPSNAQVTGSGVGVQVSPNFYYDKHFLDRLELNLRMDQLCDKKKMPKGVGNNIIFTRYANMSANTTALTVGVIPSGNSMSAAQITATPLQYGDFITLSDAIELKAIDPIVESAQELLAYEASLSLDTLIRNQIAGNVTTQIAGGDANEAAAAHVVAASDLRKSAKTLKVIGTKPKVGNDFLGVFHTASMYDLMSETTAGGFIDTAKYTSSEPILKGEMGRLWGIKLVESPNCKTGTGASSAVTYHNLITGQGAVGVVDLAGKLAVETFRKPLGSAGAADPLNQISTVGYKFWMVVSILDANRAVELIGTSAF